MFAVEQRSREEVELHCICICIGSADGRMCECDVSHSNTETSSSSSFFQSHRSAFTLDSFDRKRRKLADRQAGRQQQEREPSTGISRPCDGRRSPQSSAPCRRSAGTARCCTSRTSQWSFGSASEVSDQTATKKKTPYCACENTVVMLKQPGHFTSMKKLPNRNA